VKFKSILVHLTPIGWLLAFGINHLQKDQLTDFYLKQSFGLYLCFLISWFIPHYYIAVWSLLFVFWIYSFVGAIKNVPNAIPFIGSKFQKWFPFIG